MTVLSIQSEVAAGHVGNSAARFALQRLGRRVFALPSVLYSNHPGRGAFRGRVTPAEELTALLDGLEQLGELKSVAAVVSGYLGAAAQADVVRDAVTRVRRASPQALFLLDPVFGDEGGAYDARGVAEAMARMLLPLADITTPNRFELQSLSSRAVTDAPSAVAAARLLGPRLVLATSVPQGAELGTVLVTPEGAWATTSPRVQHAPHGTGDTLAALFLGHVLNGQSPPEALQAASSSVDALIRDAAAHGSPELRLAEAQALITAPPVLLPLQPLA